MQNPLTVEDIITVTDPVQEAYLCFLCTITTIQWKSLFPPIKNHMCELKLSLLQKTHPK